MTYFDPSRLFYSHTSGPVSTFFYEGIRIDAASDGQYRFINIGRGLPEQVMAALLHWFGMDTQRELARYRLPDNSRYYVQKAA